MYSGSPHDIAVRNATDNRRATNGAAITGHRERLSRHIAGRWWAALVCYRAAEPPRADGGNGRPVSLAIHSSLSSYSALTPLYLYPVPLKSSSIARSTLPPMLSCDVMNVSALR